MLRGSRLHNGVEPELGKVMLDAQLAAASRTGAAAVTQTRQGQEISEGDCAAVGVGGHRSEEEGAQALGSSPNGDVA